MQIILLFVNYTSTKLSTWFWQTFWIFFFNISQLQELSGMFLISQSLRIPQPHSLFRQVGIYSSVFYFFFLPVMVGIVGIGHYGLLCCILAVMFSNHQIGEHVTPTLTAELTYCFAILILNAADLENLSCFWHPFSADVQRLIFQCSLTAASVLRLWIISCLF